jgi:KDO2-lipid IV(A) lauroyltransferase
MSWKQRRNQLEIWGVRFLAWFVPKLSRGGCMKLANLMGAVAFALDKRGREVSLANIEAALGEAHTPAQRVEIIRKSYQYFARTMVDLFWTPRLNPENVGQYIKHEGGEIMREIQGRPAVVTLSHKAGFEWTGPGNGFNGFRGVVLTQAFKNQEVGAIFRHLRQIGGQEIITQEASMLRMLKAIKKGSWVGMLIDLNVMPSQASTIIDAFGMKMCATILHAVLCQRGNALVVPMESEPLEDGSTLVRIHKPLEIPPGATIQEIAQLSWNWLEPLIRAKPHLWMWSYKHWRFKPKEATRSYPFYANHSGRFEKLLKQVETEKVP